MGMQQCVLTSRPPAWSAVRDLLAQYKFPLQTRMIDGELAYPDEEPPAEWRELRIGTPQGMVTVRREEGRLVFVTWGNADRGMLEAWNAVTWGFAEACGGTVETERGALAAAEFRRVAELPEALRSPPTTRSQ